MKLVEKNADFKVKCCVCGEHIYSCETYFAVVRDNGKKIRGENYCPSHHDIAYDNNPELCENVDQDDGESHLRAMEDYAAYRVNGCTSEYYSDRDAGYAY